ncbi:MAG: AAA family ATPase [Magnetococcales bacterium]|nr:AAA family ATPase [Magnetococcales bacterium]MBF0115497.1 AAA family ATPase [Magnetococcales bacterium]
MPVLRLARSLLEALMMLDFNHRTADPSSESRPNVDRLKARLLECLESVLAYLLPAGKVRSGKFYVGDVQGNPGDSMVVELTGPKAGMWFDHATGQGGDIIGLWAEMHHLDARRDFSKILDEIASWLGDATPVVRPKANRNGPPMDDLGPHTGKWDYFSKDGKLICCVYRYDLPNGKKTYRPYDVETGKKQDPKGLLPLYHQPEMKGIQDVVFVEGEKCADALLSVGIVATTSMHGAKAPTNKTDWSPLAGKNLLIWPDLDKVGWDYAVGAAHAAVQAGAVYVAILMPPGDKPEKWDAADAIAEGMNVHDFFANAERQEIRNDAVMNQGNSTEMSITPFPAFRMADLLADESPMPEDIITPRLLTPGGMLVIGGAPKVGKSDFLINLLVYMAAGKRFMRFAPARPIGVFYLQTEIQYHYLRERMKTLCLPTEVLALAGLNLVTTPKVRMILNADGVERTVATIKSFFPTTPPDIICVDPIRNVFDGGPDGGGENDNSAMLFFLQERLEVIREAIHPETGLILCHHTSKIDKKQLKEDPFRFLSGAGSLRGFYTSGILMHRPDENNSERMLHFELRNGPGIAPMFVDKREGRWVEIDHVEERLVRQSIGEKLDAERRRKHDVILQLIYDEALQGRAYTPSQFSEHFENKAGLGGSDTITKRINVLATNGYLKFFRNSQDYSLPSANRSKFGYLCVEGMMLGSEYGEKSPVPVLPTHFKDLRSGAVLPVENPEVWIYQDEVSIPDENYAYSTQN